MHDYWIMCPRGQFIQRNPENCTDIWALCDGQSHKKCAERCYAGYFSGASDEKAIDVEYWYKWVERRMTHLRDITQYIDCFIAPSQYLRNRFIHEFGISEDKIVYLDYGFDLQRLKKRKPIKNKHFTFGYIGTHTPAKGIQHLISAFSLLRGDCQLIIWGRPRPQNTDGLKINISNLPLAVQNNIAWRSEYQNNNIVEDVFNHVDCIVVPSIWVENSPLVIHEALQMRLPVITANIGGMAEYVQHEKNGLLFEHRDYQSLAKQMQRLIDHPALARKLGARGYLQSDDANIQDLTEHTASVEAIYHRLMDKT
ncbi:hypothetical protein DFQ28_011713 [Apophysomyces sp. BC1034]|nr:hypothetical protein DFQ28_011713 [Apophysomyces sp. BC1034]